jgi:hypothetical protein
VPTTGHTNKAKIDSFSIMTHLGLVAISLLLFFIVFLFLIPLHQPSYLGLALTCLIYLASYATTYFVYTSSLHRLWLHLEQVIRINDTTYELVNLSSYYDSEKSFLDALLQKAIGAIDDAEMGSIILVDKNTNRLQFESLVELDIDALRKINFTLQETFQFRLTNGRCDKAVVINNMKNINAKSTLTQVDQDTLLQASLKPICSTLSSPIRINDELYGMMMG